ncbi:MAG: hypothetical protein RL621_321 [Bacteroidota bacterium]|jgi:hypothetical protein
MCAECRRPKGFLDFFLLVTVLCGVVYFYYWLFTQPPLPAQKSMQNNCNIHVAVIHVNKKFLIDNFIGFI